MNTVIVIRGKASCFTVQDPNPSRDKGFSTSPWRPYRPWVLHSLLLHRYRVLSLATWKQNCRGLMLTPHLHLVPDFKKEWSYTSVSLHAFMAWTATYYYYYYYYYYYFFIIIIEFLTSQLWLGNIHLSWDVVINRIRLGGLTCSLKSFLQLNMCQESQIFVVVYMYWGAG